jgi:creatinine amidohydrolase
MAVHTLASLAWTTVRDLAGPGTVAVLPTGAIEAHGPHLPLGTDVIIAEAMAGRGAERLSACGLEVLVLPALTFAPAPFAAAFPGTIHIRPDATTSVITGIAQSLAEHGITMLVITNTHHDPAHVDAIQSAVAEAGRYGCTLVFPDLTRRRWSERLTPEFKSGSHAGRYEGSVVLAVRPELVNVTVMRNLEPNVRSLVDAVRADHHTFADAGGPDAYFGSPAEATAEEGQAIIETLGTIVEEAVLEAIEQ